MKRSQTIAIIACSLLAAIILGLYLEAPAAQKKRVLFISSYHPAFPTFFHQIEGIRSVLDEASTYLDIEFMDTKRFQSPENIENFSRSLAYKLASTEPYDAILVADDNAVSFVMDNKQRLFPTSPIVFFGVNSLERALDVAEDPQVTGVVESISMQATIDLIAELHPKLHAIVALVDGTVTGQAVLKAFYHSQGRHPNARLTEISLEKLSFEELPDVLGKLDETSVLLLISAFRDKTGNVLRFEDSLALVRANLSRPIYHLYRPGLGDGVLGGKLVSHYHQGRAAAEKVRQILAGEDPSEIPVLADSPNVYMLDFTELQRFGIPLDALPEGSIVINRPTSFYSRHKPALWIAFGIVLGISLFTLALLINVLKRKRAEHALRRSHEELEQKVSERTAALSNSNAELTVEIEMRKDMERALRASEEKYRHIFDSAPIGIFKNSVDGKIIEVNPKMASILGYDGPEDLKRTVNRTNIAEAVYADPDRRREVVEAILASQTWFRYENQYRCKDGSLITCNLQYRPVTEADGTQAIEGFAEDITERWQAQQSAEELRRRLEAAQQIGKSGWWEYDVPNDRVIWPPETYALFGLDPDDGPITYDRLLACIDPSFHDHHNQKMKAILASGAAEFQYPLVHADGHRRWIWARGETQYDAAGAPVRLFGTLQDITDRVDIEAQLRRQAQIIEQVHDSIIAVDMAGHITSWNQGSERLFRFPAAEAMGRHVALVYPESSHAWLREEIIPSLMERGSLEMETTLLRKGGTAFDALVSLSVLRDAHGELSGMIGYTLDITRRRRIEEALEESRRTYTDLYENAPDMYASVDPGDASILQCNQTLADKLGYPKGEILGRPIFELYHRDCMDEVHAAFESFVTTGAVENAELVLQGKDGRKIDVILNVSAVRDEAGNIVQSRSAWRDISDLKAAREALALSELKYAGVVTAMYEGMVHQDAGGAIIGCNPAAEEILGLTRDQLMGRTSTDPRWRTIREDGSAFPGEAHPAMIALRETRPVRNVRMGVHKPSGEKTWLNISAEPILDQKTGRAASVVTTFADITAVIRADEELKRSNRELEQFAYVASHDLQEPLRAVVGFLQLLENRYAQQLDDKGRHYIDRTVKAGQRMQTLISDLLTLSRVTTLGTAFEETDLEGLVATAVDNLQATIREKKARVVSQGLPRLTVDAGQFLSLFQNLILNGIRYNRSESPLVAVGYEKHGERHRLSVRDNGIGIAPEFHERIFTLFQRLHTRQEYPGSGFGLALCKKIVERHGGRISVASEDGRGATFTIDLPATGE